MCRCRLPKTLLLAAILAAFALFAGDRRMEGQEVPADLGGPERCLANVSTDKPIYRSGEKVWIRTVLLDASTRAPRVEDDWATVKITSPTGSTVMQGNFRIQDSTGGAAWEVPEGQPGGEYTATVTFPGSGYAPAERKFDVRAYRAPRLKWDLEFLKKGYGPGETAHAALSVTRAEGGAPAGARVTVVARIDGAEVHRGQAALDAEGRVVVSFPLPGEIRDGVGTLALVIRDGGVVETAAKTIPILLRRIPMRLYPEGGDLVAGLPCGLYLEAVTPWGDPADLAAEIVDGDGRAVAEIETAHEGRGRTEFTPEAGKSYFVRVLRPAGITERAPLPAVRAGGVSLRAAATTFTAGEAITADVAATAAGPYRVVLAQREREIASRTVELSAMEPRSLAFAPPGGEDGVLRLTVYDADGAPMAERLVFVRPADRLRVEVTATPERAVPGDEVELTVRTLDESGEPVSAVVGLTVTDDSVLKMIEKRLRAPRLPVMALLEPEVRHLEDAWIYLSDDPIADRAVDLLLGTQGWRRFAFENPAGFVERHGDLAKRALALRVPAPPPMPPGAAMAGRGVRLGARGKLGRARAAMPQDAMDVAEGAPVEDASAAGIEPEDAPDDSPNAGSGPPAEAPEPAMKMRRAVADMKDAEMDDLVAGEALARAPRLLTVREYAHPLRPGRKAGDRVDFAETLYWNAGLRTDETGTAKVKFHLSDSVTSFRAMADAVDAGGRLGQADVLVESREPFYLEPKLPLEVTAGDRILLPVALVNSTVEDMDARLDLEPGEGLTVADGWQGVLRLAADGRGRLLVPVEVGRANGRISFAIAGGAGPYGDRVTRDVAVVPFGFPIHDSAGGILLPGKPQRLAVTIPEGVHMSTVGTSVKIYPTPAANLTEALRALIREPSG